MNDQIDRNADDAARCAGALLERLGRSRGFSLIELILVIVFLGIAVLSSMNLMSQSLSGSIKGEMSLTAVDLANEKMELIFSDKNTKGYGYVSQGRYGIETDVNGKAGFNRSVTVTELATSKKVEVLIQHASLDDYVLVAYLANY